MSSRVSTIAFVVALALLVPGAAMAQTEAEIAQVMEHDRAAQEHFNAEDYAAALESLEAAQAILPDTGRLYNIAVCYDRLERLEEALEAYQRYLDSPDALGEQRVDGRDRIVEIRRELYGEEPDPGGTGAGGTGDVGPGTPIEPVPRGLIGPTAFYAMLGVTAAVGAAFGSMAIYTYVVHEDFANNLTHEEQVEQREDGLTLNLATNVLLGVGLAAAAATALLAVFTYVDFGSSSASAGPTIAFSPAPGGGHVGASFTF